MVFYPGDFMKLTRRETLKGFGIATLFPLSQSLALAADAPKSRPNILWVSCEDISPNLGCYGDPHAITPTLDKLAEEGTRYTNAFTPAGVCAPCRSAIITGVNQTSLGTRDMRCKALLPEKIKLFPNTSAMPDTTARTTASRITRSSKHRKKLGMSPATRRIGASDRQTNRSSLFLISPLPTKAK